MTHVKKQKILPKVVGKSGNRVTITHFLRLIGNNFLSFFHRPIVNRGSLMLIHHRSFPTTLGYGTRLVFSPPMRWGDLDVWEDSFYDSPAHSRKPYK